MMLAVLAYPSRGGYMPLPSTLLACAVVVLGSLVWGQFIAPRLARRMGFTFAGFDAETTWRMAGTVLLMLIALTPLAFAGPPVIGNPCDTCQAIWPAWMCALDCLFF